MHLKHGNTINKILNSNNEKKKVSNEIHMREKSKRQPTK